MNKEKMLDIMKENVRCLCENKITENQYFMQHSILFPEESNQLDLFEEKLEVKK